MPVKWPEIPTCRLYTLLVFAEVCTGQKKLHIPDIGNTSAKGMQILSQLWRVSEANGAAKQISYCLCVPAGNCLRNVYVKTNYHSYAGKTTPFDVQ